MTEPLGTQTTSGPRLRHGPLACLRRLTGSLFLRLALVVGVTAVAISSASFLLLLDLRSQDDTAINRNLVQYVHFLAQEIGQPASAARAQALADRLRLRIRREEPPWSPAQPWIVSGSELAEDLPEQYLRTWYASDTVEAASIHSFHRIRLRTADGGFLTFDLHPTPGERAQSKRAAWASMGVCLLLTILAALAMRWLLRPVDRLTKAAAAVRDGDLTRRVPETRGGELRELSRTFNQMVSSLERALASQRRLVLDVSHELRTPLTRLRLQLEMLPQGAASAPAVEAMREDLREMEAMVRSILEAARLRHEAGALRLDHMDLAALVQGVAERYRAAGAELSLRLPPGELCLRADADKLGAVLRNLLDNALKYGQVVGDQTTSYPATGELAAAGQGAIELELARQGGQAVLTVRDHGPGIPAEALPHVFEPFFRADAARCRTADDGRGGFGLGLCLCQAIAQAHGGGITAENSPQGGALFRLSLPLG